MHPIAQLALFSSAIVAGAVGGAVVPLRIKAAVRQLQFMSFAAGSMLGAAFFHMLPEAAETGGYSAFLLVPAGFVVLFLLERHVLVHACEEPPDCSEHAHGSALGMTALLGLSVHTLFDGVALASAISEGVGLMAFVAIVAHKIPSSLSLAAILKAEHRADGTVLLLVAAFALMVPMGAALYYVADAWLHFESLAPRALAFSAGSFLYISVSDLLPHINRHGREGRTENILAFIAGLCLMMALRALDHSH